MTLATIEPVNIKTEDFETMLRFARSIYKLKNTPAYLEALASTLPETAAIQPISPSLLMGYDFHLSAEGPKLIEINNNAGGLWEKDDGWIPQSGMSEMQGELTQRILSMFDSSWQHIAIMDEGIENQYMYPEMKAFAALLKSDGRSVYLVSPEDLILKTEGLYVGNHKIDMIYNRHTDFYLESSVLSDIRQTFMAKQIELNPYPRSYALIGDKNRMVDWWKEGFLSFLSEEEQAFIHQIVPETRLLANCEMDQAWATRKQWVFKPAARHGGKGVLMGKSISKKRFAELDIDTTVMQQLVPASQIEIKEQSYKFDVRVYMYGENLIGLSGRAWNGQITNFREEGSGWVAISVEN
ncbi:MAG: hypothetical protein R8M14_07255 [Ghiorsea sp.]